MRLSDSMHSCLCIDEVVRLIACELVESGGKSTSVALACCCKSLEDPVLDLLWQTQNELLPLLATFPRDVWNDSECTVSPLTMRAFSLLNDLARKSFRRLPTTLELARFRKYSSRMRRLEEPNEQYGQYSDVIAVLQPYSIDKPFFPNMKDLRLSDPTREFIPSIPLFLCPRTTNIGISFNTPHLPKGLVASTIATLPTLCPNLQRLSLQSLPRDPIITAAVSGMFHARNWDTLRYLSVDSPLTEQACEVIFKLPNLYMLSAVIERDTSLPLVVLLNLINLTINEDHDYDWLQGFRGATLGKLAYVTFNSESESIGDILEAFESIALTTSIPETLSIFRFYTSLPWRPNYRSLLPFTMLKRLTVEFSCEDGCSSTIDDDIITDVARAMPGLKLLRLGDPCQTPTGVTAKGLTALARYCPHLSTLRIHFQVASLVDAPPIPGVTPGGKPIIPCALTELDVGRIPLPEESVLVVTLTLLRIFPSIHSVGCSEKGWREVGDAIFRSQTAY